MSKSRVIRRTILLLVSAALLFTASGTAEGLDILLTGNASGPFTVTFSSPSYKQLAQFGKERLKSLNRVLKHLSVDISVHGDESETAVSVDSDRVFAIRETKDGGELKRTCLLYPRRIYQAGKAPDGPEEDLISFLDGSFFNVNRLLDSLYPAFGKAAKEFRDLAKTSEANLNFSAYGKGVKRVTILFPADYVRKNFPKVLLKLTEDRECQSFLKNLTFEGTQKIVLLYDEKGNVIRINYDGSLGHSAASLRKVSAVWKCLRDKKHKKDSLTLKTPAVKGYDRDNIIYERDLNQASSKKQTLAWDLQIDRRSGNDRETVKFTGDLKLADGMITGKAELTEKQKSVQTTTVIVPELKKENGSVYTGTLEITGKTGKITVSGIKTDLSIHPGTDSWKDAAQSGALLPADMLKEDLNAVLIRKLLSLPKDDLLFFSQDISSDVWKSLIQSIYQEIKP